MDSEDESDLDSETTRVATVDDAQDSRDLKTGVSGRNTKILSDAENDSEIAENGSGTCPGPNDVTPGSGNPPPVQLVSSTSGPLRPVGGSGSTDTAHVSRPASGDEIVELVEAFVRRGEQSSYDTTVETRGATQKEVHVHLTQTNIHNPAAIALGGHVVVQPPKKNTKTPETPQHSTEIQRLRGDMESLYIM